MDLFIYDIKKQSSKKIVKGVYSKPTWNDNKLYYSKKPKRPNREGSKYYDLYEYDLLNKKEFRLTQDARAFSPVFVPKDSTLFYLATFDGTQNIFKIDLKV